MRALALVLLLAACRGERHYHVAAGPMNACALSNQGEVTCWGNGGGGMIGDGANDYFPGARMPGRVRGVDDATAITVGLSSACALRKDGHLACWGIDWQHATTTTSESVNHAVPMPIERVAQVSAGRSHVCAVTEDGKVSCWGDNADSQAGHPSDQRVLTTPTVVPGIADAVEVAAGDTFSCVRHRAGTVSCFGLMQLPKPEDCENAPSDVACVKEYAPGVLEAARKGTEVPRVIEGLHDVVQLAAGSHFACARTNGGEVWCWGTNTLGELGTGDNVVHDKPVRAKLKDIVAISASSSWNACALNGAGEVRCWGALQPSAGKENGPAKVDGLGKASELAAGDDFACAVLDDGVWCWGSARDGETGHGAIDGTQPPDRVAL